MKPNPKDPDLAKWCEVLSTSVMVDVVPPGWLTATAIADKLNRSRRTIGTMLTAAVTNGKAEKQSFRITSGQVTRPVPHYKLK